ncbi:mucin-2-like [Cocos nucifera]|uniref:Mucin-2-like n=1 Tax=Cocos nucifera TaxID=13894 RepID=A0A8K0ILW4_COCNU|nr:mucin-2-like [Cocos nucifera]
MAPKKDNKGRRRRSKTPGQASASDPNPTATSPSASAPTGDATTASLVPSSTFPSAQPTTTTTTTQLIIPSAPPLPTSLLPSSASRITATPQPLPSAPPLSIQETHQGRVSCTSGGATITDLADPSISPSASAASTRTPTLLPITGDFISLFAPAVAGAMAALLSGKEEEPAAVQEMIVAMFGLHLDEMESVIGSLLGVAMNKMGDAELKAASDALADVEVLKSTVRMAEMLLAERKKRHGSGGSCGGSAGEGGGPDSGSGEGDGEGGGVSV